ncbi:hypothetical protein RJ55_08261 [Drechmeria coniospora]|nr:hypothetical protein RJ55_08261 [Drechmeria coniospora]
MTFESGRRTQTFTLLAAHATYTTTFINHAQTNNHGRNQHFVQFSSACTARHQPPPRQLIWKLPTPASCHQTSPWLPAWLCLDQAPPPCPVPSCLVLPRPACNLITVRSSTRLIPPTFSTSRGVGSSRRASAVLAFPAHLAPSIISAECSRHTSDTLPTTTLVSLQRRTRRSDGEERQGAPSLALLCSVIPSLRNAASSRPSQRPEWHEARLSDEPTIPPLFLSSTPPPCALFLAPGHLPDLRRAAFALGLNNRPGQVWPAHLCVTPPNDAVRAGGTAMVVAAAQSRSHDSLPQTILVLRSSCVAETISEGLVARKPNAVPPASGRRGSCEGNDRDGEIRLAAWTVRGWTIAASLIT